MLRVQTAQPRAVGSQLMDDVVNEFHAKHGLLMGIWWQYEHLVSTDRWL